MKNIPTSRLAVKRRTHSDSGFTLVEMLVAVTLVMLMMTMFAQVLQMATDSVGTQQVISENDQKARSLTTVMRADFLSRTMRYPWAFYPSEDPATSPTFKTKQRDGYLYISTNLPDNALDDLIQFTVHSNQLSDFNNNPDYFGRGSFLLDTEAIANGFGGGTLYNNPNQPEADDDEMSPNGTGSSPAAEISYFVRNGNLYRRVVLLREPLDIAGFGSQPISSRDFDLFRGDHNVMDATIPTVNEHLFELSDGTRTNDYWRNFDFSARVPLPPTLGVWAQLLGVNSLNNEPSSGTGSVDSLGNPLYRWGFDMFSARSREHDNTTNAAFIGRLLHAETSAVNFNFPQSVCAEEGSAEPDAGAPGTTVTMMGSTGNPFDILGVPLDLDIDDDLVDQFDQSGVVGDKSSGLGGPRAMEDLLLANVHEFKVEIWDERYGDFVAPAYGNRTPTAAEISRGIGDYHFSRMINLNVGPWGVIPSTPRNRVFDTWHPAVGGSPSFDFDFDGDTTLERDEVSPPFIAYEYYPPKTDGTAPQIGPTPSSVPNSAFASVNRGYWVAGDTYNVGDVVFTPWDEAIDSGPDDGLFQYTEMNEPKFAFAFRAIKDDDNSGDGVAGTNPDIFRVSTPGIRISDNELIWESIDNRRPLKAVRIKIRFLNQKSNEPRQLTLVLPLTDT